MSRIGKKPIEIPSGVNVNVAGDKVVVKGPLGELSVSIFKDIEVSMNENVINIVANGAENNKKINALYGLFRSLLSNSVEGVSKGYEKELEIIGVGYRATQQSKDIKFQLGYSHDIIFAAPEGITLEVLETTKLRIKGIDKQQVGQVAANIRKLRPPEPYKGKGIRYKNEYVRKKAGKAGK